MNATLMERYSPELAVIVAAFAFIHLSLVPGPSASVQPSWLANWDVHLLPYAMFAAIFVLNSFRFDFHVRDWLLATGFPLLLLGYLGAIIFDIHSVSAIGADTVTMVVVILVAGTWFGFESITRSQPE